MRFSKIFLEGKKARENGVHVCPYSVLDSLDDYIEWNKGYIAGDLK